MMMDEPAFFELVLDTAAVLFEAGYDRDYKEGIATLAAQLLLDDTSEQAILLVCRALKGSI
jgi:hypothetical protein